MNYISLGTVEQTSKFAMDLRLMICVAVLVFASVEAMRFPESGRPCYVRCPIGFKPDLDCRCRRWSFHDMSPCDLMRCPLNSQCEVRGSRGVCIPDGIGLPTEPLLPNEPLPIDPIVPFDVCGLPKETGLCLAYFPRYYYNSATGKCDEFIYGGCGGNENNFRTLLECNSRCVRQPRHSYY